MEKRLRILFLTHSKSLNIGTYRIWIKDYCRYLKEAGIEASVKLLEDLTEDVVQEYDVFILGKIPHQLYQEITNFIWAISSQKVIGAITPPSNFNDVLFDFAMTGSPEEADSLSFHKNTIINAHIESLYWGSTPKTHSSKEVLKICVHGWTAHLASFSPNLKAALEEFEKEQEIELVIISESTNPDWKIGRPVIKKISFLQWDLSTIKKNIQECDIGLVPGIHDLTHTLDKIDNRNGMFETDYIFRFKNKCNNGRSLVFFYLGIPVVADFSPSNSHILGGGDCGFIAHSKDGWLSSLRKLKNEKTRQLVASKALERANTEYNPHEWAKKYYDSMYSIFKDKQS